MGEAFAASAYPKCAPGSPAVLVRPDSLEQTAARHLAFWTERLDDPSFVYVVQGDPGGTPFKVGMAKDVPARIATLQTGNPYRLRLLCVLPGALELEWQLHQRLKGERTYGEWFKPSALDDFLTLVAVAAERMVAAYDGSGQPPWFRSFIPCKQRRYKRKDKDGITVRHMEPRPVDQEIAQARLRAHWCR